MKNIFLILFVLSSGAVLAQGDVHGRRLISDSAIYLRGTRIDSISNDTTNAANRLKTLLTSDAVYKLIQAHTGTGGVSSLNGNTGALTMDTNYISNFYLKVRAGLSASGPLSFSNGTFSISQANGSTNGYLSSTDWTTFNNKLSTIDTSNISNFYLKVRAGLSASGPLSFSNGIFSISQANGSTNGYLSSTDWTTFNNKLSTIDTSNISNFYLKVRAGLSASGPLSFSNGTFSISQANGSTNGYLSSSDWTTFNNKQNPLTIGNLTSTTVGIGITNGIGAVIGAGTAINIAYSNGSTNGLLSSTDWNTFNGKISGTTVAWQIPYGNTGGTAYTSSNKLFVASSSGRLVDSSEMAALDFQVHTLTGSMGTPSSGGVFYAKTDKLPYFKNTDGTEMPLYNTGSSAYSGLTDVNVSSPADNDFSVYQTSNSKWNNKTLAQVKAILGIDTIRYLYYDSTLTPLAKKISATVMKIKSLAINERNKDIPAANIQSSDSTVRFIIPNDTTALASFSVGANNAGDTALFSTTNLYGSFYNASSDTLYITDVKAVLQGSSDTLGIDVMFSDTLNAVSPNYVIAGFALNNNTVGQLAPDITNRAILPNKWVYCKSSTVVAGKKPKYLSVTLIGYKRRR